MLQSHKKIRYHHPQEEEIQEDLELFLQEVAQIEEDRIEEQEIAALEMFLQEEAQIEEEQREEMEVDLKEEEEMDVDLKEDPQEGLEEDPTIDPTIDWEAEMERLMLEDTATLEAENATYCQGHSPSLTGGVLTSSTCISTS